MEAQNFRGPDLAAHTHSGSNIVPQHIPDVELLAILVSLRVRASRLNGGNIGLAVQVGAVVQVTAAISLSGRTPLVVLQV